MEPINFTWLFPIFCSTSAVSQMVDHEKDGIIDHKLWDRKLEPRGNYYNKLRARWRRSKIWRKSRVSNEDFINWSYEWIDELLCSSCVGLSYHGKFIFQFSTVHVFLFWATATGGSFHALTRSFVHTFKFNVRGSCRTYFITTAGDGVHVFMPSHIHLLMR